MKLKNWLYQFSPKERLPLLLFVLVTLFFCISLLGTPKNLLLINKALLGVLIFINLPISLQTLRYSIHLKKYQSIYANLTSFEKTMFNFALDSLQDGIILLKDKEIIYVNKTAEKILKLPNFELLEKKMSLNYQSALKFINSLSNSIMPIEYIADFDEKRITFLFSFFPVSSQFADTMIHAQNISLIKSAQQAREIYMATLAHEVRTPITSLTMASRLLFRSVDKFEDMNYRNLITTCANETDRVRALVEDVISAAKYDMLTHDLEIKNVEFGKLLKNVVNSYSDQIHHCGIELSYQIESLRTPIVIPIDATKIVWAISNFIMDALKQIPRGGKILINLTTSEDQVEMKIRYLGHSIENNYRENIFDKFNDLDSISEFRNVRSGAVGAELAIAREYILAHGGRIKVNSELGHGTELCFSLPLKRPTSAFKVKKSAGIYIK